MAELTIPSVTGKKLELAGYEFVFFNEVTNHSHPLVSGDQLATLFLLIDGSGSMDGFWTALQATLKPILKEYREEGRPMIGLLFDHRIHNWNPASDDLPELPSGGTNIVKAFEETLIRIKEKHRRDPSQTQFDIKFISDGTDAYRVGDTLVTALTSVFESNLLPPTIEQISCTTLAIGKGFPTNIAMLAREMIQRGSNECQPVHIADDPTEVSSAMSSVLDGVVGNIFECPSTQKLPEVPSGITLNQWFIWNQCNLDGGGAAAASSDETEVVLDGITHKFTGQVCNYEDIFKCVNSFATRVIKMLITAKTDQPTAHVFAEVESQARWVLTIADAATRFFTEQQSQMVSISPSFKATAEGRKLFRMKTKEIKGLQLMLATLVKKMTTIASGDARKSLVDLEYRNLIGGRTTQYSDRSSSLFGKDWTAARDKFVTVVEEMRKQLIGEYNTAPCQQIANNSAMLADGSTVTQFHPETNTFTVNDKYGNDHSLTEAELREQGFILDPSCQNVSAFTQTTAGHELFYGNSLLQVLLDCQTFDELIEVFSIHGFGIVLTAPNGICMNPYLGSITNLSFITGLIDTGSLDTQRSNKTTELVQLGRGEEANCVLPLIKYCGEEMTNALIRIYGTELFRMMTSWYISGQPGVILPDVTMAMLAMMTEWLLKNIQDSTTEYQESLITSLRVTMNVALRTKQIQNYIEGLKSNPTLTVLVKQHPSVETKTPSVNKVLAIILASTVSDAEATDGACADESKDGDEANSDDHTTGAIVTSDIIPLHFISPLLNQSEACAALRACCLRRIADIVNSLNKPISYWFSLAGNTDEETADEFPYPAMDQFYSMKEVRTQLMLIFPEWFEKKLVGMSSSTTTVNTSQCKLIIAKQRAFGVSMDDMNKLLNRICRPEESAEFIKQLTDDIPFIVYHMLKNSNAYQQATTPMISNEKALADIKDMLVRSDSKTLEKEERATILKEGERRYYEMFDAVNSGIPIVYSKDTAAQYGDNIVFTDNILHFGESTDIIINNASGLPVNASAYPNSPWFAKPRKDFALHAEGYIRRPSHCHGMHITTYAYVKSTDDPTVQGLREFSERVIIRRDGAYTNLTNVADDTLQIVIDAQLSRKE